MRQGKLTMGQLKTRVGQLKTLMGQAFFTMGHEKSLKKRQKDSFIFF